MRVNLSNSKHKIIYLYRLIKNKTNQECYTYSIQGDSEISLGKKTVIGDDEKKSLAKKCSYKSFFVFEIQIIENLVKIASTLLS
jgi:hypothetical protein